MEPWRRNLYALAIAEFFVLVGFASVTPFLPLFIQKLGNYSNTEAALWSGLAIGGSGFAMFVCAPLWGLVADRSGRKAMLLRAQFAGAVILALIGVAPNVPIVVVLRIMQGVFTGTVSAASALVANTTPREKLPFAMGFLMVAVFGGQTMGPLLGGYTADVVGYQASFLIGGVVIFLATFLVLFLVNEKFVRAPAGQRESLGDIWQLARSRKLLPLLIALVMAYAGPWMISPIVPLFIRELDPTGDTATQSGLSFFLLGVLATVSSLAAGRLAARFSMNKILFISFLGTAFLCLPPIWAGTVAALIFFVALTGLPRGGSITSLNSLISLSSPSHKQGLAFGLAQSASSLGVGLGPLIGGVFASVLGFRSVFLLSAAMFIAAAVVTSWLVAREPATQKAGAVK